MATRVVGMISGTSYDAVEVAAADFDLAGEVLTMTPLGASSVDIPPEIRARIAAALPPAATSMEEVCRLDTELGQLFGAAAARGCRELAGGTADLVVSHGQTVFHWVEGAHALGTLQLGSASWIAEATGVPVLSDLRTRDIARGGHGAPLVSILDALLLLGDDVRRGALNLGGIANLTVRSEDVLAWDLGPANALVDAAVVELTGGAEAMDRDGARGARGAVRTDLLDVLLAEPYFKLPAPKSTGKELFHGDYLTTRVAQVEPVAPDDLVATVTELTGVLVGRACRDHALAELVVAGGGVRNPTLMRRIAELSAPTVVTTMDEYGVGASAKEAYLFALLGFLSLNGLPGTIASATGATAPSVLGSFTPGAVPLRLPEPAATAPRRLVIAG